jgi:Zn-dependent metalloprotease
LLQSLDIQKLAMTQGGFMARSTLIQLGFTAMIAVGPATAALALVAPDHHLTSKAVTKLLQRGESVLRPDTVFISEKKFANRFDANTQIQIDAKSSAVRIITGDLTPEASSLQARELIDIATNWIAAHEDLLQVQVDDVSLVDAATLITPDVQFLRFAVARNGISVQDASINFRFKQGKLVQVQSRSFGEALDDNTTSFISAKDAVEMLAPGAVTREIGQTYRVEETSSGYKLVLVRTSLVDIEGETLKVQTSAQSGALFATENTRRYAGNHAHGQVFPRTYFESETVDVPMMELDLQVGSSTATTDLDGHFSHTGTSAPSVSGLKGKKFRVNSRTGGTVSRTATQVEGNWDLNLDVSTEKDQAQVHTFHHLNLMVQKAKKYVSSPWMERPLTANVNLSQTCNAYWDGYSVNFFSAGSNCGNTGLISDVMYHEWGHGFDENTGGIDDGAYSEGFGDIMSMVMTNDSRLGPGFRSNGGIVRDMEPDKVYPKDRGEVHAEGLIIGGTFWDLFKSLSEKYDADTANELVSEIAFKTIFTATTYRDVYQAALVVNDNDTDMSSPGPDFCEINSAFALHGLAVKSPDCE